MITALSPSANANIPSVFRIFQGICTIHMPRIFGSGTYMTKYDKHTSPLFKETHNCSQGLCVAVPDVVGDGLAGGWPGIAVSHVVQFSTNTGPVQQRFAAWIHR